MAYPPILNYLQMILLFLVVHDKNISTSELKSELRKISNWENGK